MVTLVQPELVQDGGELDNTVSISCVHGDTKAYPTTVVQLATIQGRCQIRVGVVPTLPVPILLGRDCPVFPVVGLFAVVSDKALKTPER